MNKPFKDIEEKIQDWNTLLVKVNDWKEAGETIVFTNGCFDLLHYGHVHYLAEARALGDRLIIGLNSDSSVQKLKGIHRPIKDQLSRMFVLASFEFVDAVAVFDTETPFRLIAEVQPDILVKGGDWQPKDIVGSDIVLDNGGKVLSLPFVEGFSTTKMENKILEHHPQFRKDAQ